MAFLLDTNVVSELRRQSADQQVLDWQKSHNINESWLSVLTLLEIRHGTERVRKPDPVFAAKLDDWYHNILLKIYSGRILPVTLDTCEIKASFGGDRTLALADALIGATAKQHDLTLVTRNTKDFEDLGINLINPWERPHD